MVCVSRPSSDSSAGCSGKSTEGRTCITPRNAGNSLSRNSLMIFSSSGSSTASPFSVRLVVERSVRRRCMATNASRDRPAITEMRPAAFSRSNDCHALTASIATMQVAMNRTIDVSRVVTEIRFSIVQAFVARFDRSALPKTGTDQPARGQHIPKMEREFEKRIGRIRPTLRCNDYGSVATRPRRVTGIAPCESANASPPGW